MNLDEYRKNADLVEYASSLLSSRKFKLLLDALRGSHPKNYRTNIKGLPISDKSEELGRIYGYDEYENNLFSAAQPLIEQTMPQATFGVELDESK